MRVTVCKGCVADGGGCGVWWLQPVEVAECGVAARGGYNMLRLQRVGALAGRGCDGLGLRSEGVVE